jgi:hypothetical protein
METNPPSEREWTIEEREEFFSSQDAITGLPNAFQMFYDHWMNPTGIHVTSIVPPEQGWLIAFHCPLCKETTFILSPWAIKPEKGDYWRMTEMCASEEHCNQHNLIMTMQRSFPPPVWTKGIEDGR